LSPEVWSIIAFVAIFVFGTTLNVNLGVLAFAAAFLLAATVAGVPPAELYTMFPGDIFVLLFSMLLLLSLVKATGAIDWLVRVTIAGVRGRIILIPWVLFALSAFTSAIGPGALILLAGIGVTFSRRYNLNRLLLALLIIHGSQAGALSPVKPYSVVIRGILESAGLPFDAMILFAGGFVFNTAAAVVGFTVLGGWRLLKRTERVTAGESEGDAELVTVGGTATVAAGSNQPPGRSAPSPSGRVSGATKPRGDLAAPEPKSKADNALMLGAVLAIVGVIVGAGVFRWDLAATAIVVAAVLAMVMPLSRRTGVIEGISWPVIVLVSGMLTFMALLEQMGTFTFLVDGLRSFGSGLLALLLVCYLAGAISAVASSFATLVVTLPLALGVVAGTPLAEGLAPTLIATAIVVASTIVDISPFSTLGALVLGAAEPSEQPAFQKTLLKYAGVIVLIAPGVAWAALILPVWLLA
jgi:di/tricarboxylate transporter